MGNLSGKVALITGAAGGIGRATSKLFIDEGAKGVVMADIWDEMGEKFADELGPNAIYIHTDVSQETDIKNAIDLAIEKFNQLDIVFSNAGNPGSGVGLEEIETKDFDHTMAIHLRGGGLMHEAFDTLNEKARFWVFYFYWLCSRISAGDGRIGLFPL